MLARFAPFAAAVLTALLPLAGATADSDRQQSTQVSADALRHDEQQRLSVFTGHVVLTRGGLVIAADRLSLKEETVGQQTGVATGDPATFERVRAQAPNERIVGQAQRITYDSKTNSLQLRGQAQMRRLRDGQLSDEVRGEAIDYFDDSGIFTAESKAPSGKPNGRVHVIIGPKDKGQ